MNCRICGAQYELPKDYYTRTRKSLRDESQYCSMNCQTAYEKSYDKHVDPLGWHSNPDRVSTND